MPWPDIATLNGTNLPPQFSYSPYVPPKRLTIKRTATSVITQASSPVIIHGDGTISFSLRAAYRNEYVFFQNLYTASTPATYAFVGYWGDSYTVRINVLDQATVRGRLFDFGGQFQVVSVSSYAQTGPCG